MHPTSQVRQLLSGNEAIAYAALDCQIALGTGYPGTPSTEILESFFRYGGRAQWSPNEKVALEVALGAAYAAARALVTMKHVGLNVAADPLFTAAYTGVTGALIVISADDPGMASSQNEQDNRHYAEAAGLPMLEPSDPQEAYDIFFQAVELSERWQIPVLYRLTTRVCHSKAPVLRRDPFPVPGPAHFDRDPRGRVMIPAHARQAHVRLREKLAALQAWNETSALTVANPGTGSVGIVTSGAAFLHVREAVPEAAVLKLGMTYPLPIEKIRAFAAGVGRCLVIEEGDPFLATAIRAAGIAVQDRPAFYRFGELTVERVRRLVAGDDRPEPKPAAGAKPPQLCPGCPHRRTFEILRRLDCIVAGDIGCYTLGVLPPFEAMDACVCMGASIGLGLGLRQVLPPDQAKRVVSVIGDSTFVHSGLTGLVEMVYNPPATGHVLILLDNGTTAMTGLQEHPGTGRTLAGEPAHKISYERVASAMGIQRIFVIDPIKHPNELEKAVAESLAVPEVSFIISSFPCLLAAKRIRAAEATAVNG